MFENAEEKRVVEQVGWGDVVEFEEFEGLDRAITGYWGLTSTQRGAVLAVLFSAGNKLGARNVSEMFGITRQSADVLVSQVVGVTPGVTKTDGLWGVGAPM